MKITTLFRALIYLCLVFNLTSCATIFSGTKATVRIKSGNVEKAQVYYNGIYKGEAPETIAVSKRGLKSGTGVIEIRAEGYQPAQIKLERKMQTGFLLVDILLAPTVLPLVIDIASGALYRGYPGRVDWHLEKKVETAQKQ